MNYCAIQQCLYDLSFINYILYVANDGMYIVVITGDMSELCLNLNPLTADHDIIVLNLFYEPIKSLIFGMK